MMDREYKAKEEDLSGVKFILVSGILIFSQIFLDIIAILWYEKRNGGDILWLYQENIKFNLQMMG